MKDNLRKIKYSISSENNIQNLENEEDINTQVKTFSWKLSLWWRYVASKI